MFGGGIGRRRRRRERAKGRSGRVANGWYADGFYGPRSRRRKTASGTTSRKWIFRPVLAGGAAAMAPRSKWYFASVSRRLGAPPRNGAPTFNAKIWIDAKTSRTRAAESRALVATPTIRASGKTLLSASGKSRITSGHSRCIRAGVREHGFWKSAQVYSSHRCRYHYVRVLQKTILIKKKIIPRMYRVGKRKTRSSSPYEWWTRSFRELTGWSTLRPMILMLSHPRLNVVNSCDNPENLRIGKST